MSENEVTIDMIKAAAGEKARQDDAFRAELLANPHAAVEKLIGTALPPQITIKAIEEAPNTYIIGVPAKGTIGANGELSDGELEAVAGGSKAGAKKFFTQLGSAMLSSGGGQAGAFKGNTAHHVKPCG
jgi:hypothetical protein